MGENFVDRSNKDRPLVISSMSSLAMDVADITDDDNFASILESNISIFSMKSDTGAVTTRLAPTIDHETLSKCWCITPECAKATVQKRTQWGVRTCLYPLLVMQYPTNDQMLRYK